MADRSNKRDRCWRRFRREVQHQHTMVLLWRKEHRRQRFWLFTNPDRAWYSLTYTRRLSSDLIVDVRVNTIEDYDIYIEHQARKRRDNYKVCRHECCCNPRHQAQRIRYRLTIQENRADIASRQALAALPDRPLTNNIEAR